MRRMRHGLLLAALSFIPWTLAGWITTDLALQLAIFCAFVASIGAVAWLTRSHVIQKPTYSSHGSDASTSPVRDDNDPSTAWVQPSATQAPIPYSKEIVAPLSRVQVNVPQPQPPGRPTQATTTLLHKDARSTSDTEFLKTPVPRQTGETPSSHSGAAKAGIARPPETERKPKVGGVNLFDPNHYRRHSGVPGFLYMARNPFHQVGLYKLGYTTVSPVARVVQLNKEHDKASDVGHFELMHSVPVSASYDAEQALFDVISEARVLEKREFFFETHDYLARSLDAAGSFSAGTSSALTQFYEWSLDRDTWTKFRPEPPQSTVVPPLRNAGGGWIFVTRNQWHREELVRVSYSKHNPLQMLKELNATQRKLTAQLGFYTLVLCVDVDDLYGTWKTLNMQLAKYRVTGTRVYYEAPLPLLARMIDGARGSSVAPVQSIQVIRPSDSQIAVEEVRGRPPAAWAAWTAPCPACAVTLRFQGAIGDFASVGCPACRQRMDCRVGPRGVVVHAVYEEG